MKTTIVPAQVTTVEDTIAGNLSLTQVVLMIVAVLIVAIITAGLPPLLKLRAYKVVLAFGCGLPCLVLAYRWRGQLLLVWLQMKLRYQFRPRLYLLSEYDELHCHCLRQLPVEQQEGLSASGERRKPLPSLRPNEYTELHRAIKTARRLRFLNNTKGEISVVIE